jgi:tetratricopeptide (TPR) repeat protein
MTKVVQFPFSSPEKFGFRPVRKRTNKTDPKGQLNLFSGARIVKLNQLSPFEEALMLDEQQDARAIAMYEEAIRQIDAMADAYCNLGIIYSQRQDFSKAVDCFTKSLKEDPRHFESHYNLANVYAELGNWPLAKLHYQVSIEIEPDFPNSYFNLGLTQARGREWQAAIDSLTQYLLRVSLEEGKQARELIQQMTASLQPE